MLPILIALLQSDHRGNALVGWRINVLGMSMMLGFVMSFGFLLPINAPQNMVCISAESFTSRQFLQTGIWLTFSGYLLMLLLSVT